jgi:ketosteroid isomerase-like protein
MHRSYGRPAAGAVQITGRVRCGFPRVADGAAPGGRLRENAAMDNAELVRSAFEAFLRGDLDALREAMDPEAQWLWYEAGPWDCHGREAVLDRLGQRVGAITGLDGVVAGGELVALEASGPELAAHLVITLRDGRIVRLEDHRSRADALVAAGADAGEIVDGSPGPRTEMRVRDPDGYVLMIAQLDPEATTA